MYTYHQIAVETLKHSSAYIQTSVWISYGPQPTFSEPVAFSNSPHYINKDYPLLQRLKATSDPYITPPPAIR
jgi:hypothetical protein